MAAVLALSSGQAGPLPWHSSFLPLQVLLFISHGKPAFKT
jgi:hypothetical protein